jgi:polyketide cyclase/dehydrase/lipid transport protein
MLRILVRVSTSRLCRASKETIWSILEDVDNWTDWTDPNSKTHLLSHKAVKREGNVVVCLEEEIAGGYKVKHTDRYTFYPKDKVVEEIIEGPISGSFELTLKENPEGTMLGWSFDVKAETLRFRILGALRGKSIMQGIAEEYCRQLAEYAETQQRSLVSRKPIPA